MIEQGIWKHWKGGEYDVIGVALNRDSGQEVVVYRPRYGERKLEYKTVEEWTSPVKLNAQDYKGPRYWLLMSNSKGLES